MANYNALTPELIEQLKAAAPGHFLTGEEVNEDYSHDEMPIYGKHMPDGLLIYDPMPAKMERICRDFGLMVPEGQVR